MALRADVLSRETASDFNTDQMRGIFINNLKLSNHHGWRFGKTLCSVQKEAGESGRTRAGTAIQGSRTPRATSCELGVGGIAIFFVSLESVSTIFKFCTFSRKGDRANNTSNSGHFHLPSGGTSMSSVGLVLSVVLALQNCSTKSMTEVS